MKARNLFGLSSIALAVLTLMAQQASAQSAPAPDSTVHTFQDIEVTGSSIKTAAEQDALPVTVMKAEDFANQGFTSVADVIDSLSIGASNIAGGARGGTTINLRGLGLNRTLVLLNGRRLANEATQDAYINVDVIPYSALERVEILRDGASSIYGTDAIGGVINFITTRNYSGGKVTGQYLTPQASGGGDQKRADILYGIGDLDSDGWNFLATADYHTRSLLPLSARPNVTNPDILNGLGIGAKAGSGSYSYPANVSAVINGKTVVGNPYYASGCLAPFSLQALSNTCINNNTPLYGVAVAEANQTSFFSKGSMKLGADNIVSLEVLYAREYTLAVASPTTSVGFAPLGGGSAPIMQINSSSPFYPGGSAGVPAVPGITGTPTLNVTWQLDSQGPAIIKNQQTTDRAVLSDAGQFHGWDYKAGLVYSKNDQIQKFDSGYFNGPLLDAGVLNGILNPFGAQTAAGNTYLGSIIENGPARHSTVTYTGVDFTGNHDLMTLGGGSMIIALGTEFHHDALSDIAPQEDANVPYNGRNPSTAQATRNLAAFFTELDVPITKELDLDFAWRADHYSDFGSTFNPKASFRYQPLDAVMFRGSYNTGFRAPSLIDRYGYRLPGATTTSGAVWDDPLLCPGVIGQPGTGKALAGYNSTTVCNAKQPVQTGSNPKVDVENSQDISLGFVVTPVRQLTIGVDWWRIHLKNTIGTLGQAFIFNNPVKYANLFVRNPDGSLAYVVDTIQNLGDTVTSGYDLDMSYAFQTENFGNFTAKLTGTYVDIYQFQNEKDGAWVGAVGNTSGLNTAPVSSTPVFIFRWKHTLSLAWSKGDWSTLLTEAYSTRIHDLNAFAVGSPYIRDIDKYSVINLSATYKGFKNIELEAGINNLMNVNPPLSNDSLAGNGYASNVASPVGRAFVVTGTYKF